MIDAKAVTARFTVVARAFGATAAKRDVGPLAGEKIAMHPCASTPPIDEQRWPVAALLIGTYARLSTGSTATEWAFDRWLVEGFWIAKPSPASMMTSDSPAGFDRAAKKYLLLPGLYQISSPPPSLGSDASTVPSRSSMIAVLAPAGPTLHPSPI